METEILDLVLFIRDPNNVARAVDAGVQSFMVDMEWRGKRDRQYGADTEIAPKVTTHGSDVEAEIAAVVASMGEALTRRAEADGPLGSASTVGSPDR